MSTFGKSISILILRLNTITKVLIMLYITSFKIDNKALVIAF